MEGREHVKVVRDLIGDAAGYATAGSDEDARRSVGEAVVRFADYVDTHAAPDVINMQRMAREILFLRAYIEEDM